MKFYLVFLTATFMLAACGEATNGTDGKDGAQGAAGEKGEAGTSCSVAPLDDANLGYKILCGGDSVGVLLNGIAGEKGDKGDVGETGAQGIQGEKGDKGDKGDTGETGAQGIQGEKGDAGADGKDGEAGKSCTVVPLASEAGYSVYCGDEYVGDLLNGSDGKDGENGKDGEDGKDGTSCNMVDNGDETVTITCGDKAFTIKTNGSGDVTEEETFEITNRNVTGFSQKGPFVNGSTVTLYELSKLNMSQTGKSFIGKITTDDGLFNVSNINLTSSYVKVTANGYYRNEVTGGKSTSQITLNALTDLTDRENVNVNLLTHLEYDRANYLLNEEGDHISIAKRTAKNEVFKAFYVTGISTNTEDLNIFTAGEGNAALLAISIMLQGNLSDADLTARLSAFSTDLEKDGTWDKLDLRGTIAKWAADVDLNLHTTGNGYANDLTLPKIRDQVSKWDLGPVPEFEKYLRHYWSLEYGLGVCGSDTVPVGTVKNAINNNGYASKDYAATYTSQSNKKRFICVDSTAEHTGKMWRVATDIEKDTMGLKHGATTTHEQASVINGLVNTNYVYVYEYKTYRRGTDLDKSLGLGGCTKARVDSVWKSGSTWYTCVDTSFTAPNALGTKTAWRVATDIEKDTAGWGHDFKTGDVRNGRVNTNLVYVYEDDKWRHGTAIDSLMFKQKADGGKACTEGSLNDTSAVKINDLYYVCSAGERDTSYRWTNTAGNFYNDTYEARSNCTAATDGDLMNGRVNTGKVYACNGTTGWREVTDGQSKTLGGCYTNLIDSVGLYSETYYVCRTNGWERASEARYNTVRYDCNKNGELKNGLVNTDKYYTCDADTFRVETDPVAIDYFSEACVSYIESPTKVTSKNGTKWTCENGRWVWDGDTIAGTMTDSRDGKKYKTVVMGSQTWMAENLNYDPGDVSAMGEKAWSGCLDDAPVNCVTYGRLYTWEVAMNKAACAYGKTCTPSGVQQGICPEGWHLPSNSDWNTLWTSIGDASTAGTKLKSTSGWWFHGNGTDDYGFSVLPAGYRYYDYDYGPQGSGSKGYDAYFWSSTELNGTHAYYEHFSLGGAGVYEGYYDKYYGYSVRCLKDSP